MKLFMLIMCVILDLIKGPVIVPDGQQHSCTQFMFLVYFLPHYFFHPSFLPLSFPLFLPSSLVSFPLSLPFFFRIIMKLLCVLSHFSHVWLFETLHLSPSGSSAQGILQARILEWVVVTCSKGFSWSRDQTMPLMSPACQASSLSLARP